MKNKTLYTVKYEYYEPVMLETFESMKEAKVVCDAYNRIFPGCCEVERVVISPKPWWVDEGMSLFSMRFDADGNFQNDFVLPISAIKTPKEGKFTSEWHPSRDKWFVSCIVWAEDKEKAIEIAKNHCQNMKVIDGKLQ